MSPHRRNTVRSPKARLFAPPCCSLLGGTQYSNAVAQNFYAKDSSSPRDSAVPGQYFFNLGVDEINKNDYRYAITLYKLAASWAYKPADFNGREACCTRSRQAVGCRTSKSVAAS